MAGSLYDEAVEELDGQPKGKPSTYDRALQIIGTQDQAQESRLRVSLTTNQSADQAAEDRRLGLKFGVPTTVVSRDRETYQKRETADRPFTQIRQDSPKTTAWVEKPENAALAHDDLENLGFLEWVTAAPAKAFAQTIDQQSYGRLRFRSMFEALTQNERDLMSSAKLGMERGGDLGADTWFRKAITGAASFLANQAPVVEYGLAGAGAGAAVGAAVGAPIAGIGALPGALSGAGYGARAGLLYGVLKSTFQQETAGAYDEFIDFKDELGQPIDPNVAKMAALAVGTINAPIEAGAQEFLLRSIPGLEKLGATGAKAAVKQALRNPTIRAALGQGLASYAKTLTAETGQEVGQRAVTILAGELSKIASGQDIKGRSGSDIASDLAREAVGAAQSFSLALLPGASLTVATNARKARNAAGNAAFFQALGEGVTNSKVAQRAPDALRSFLEDATKDGPVATVYAPTDTWATYWQSKGIDPREMAQAVTGDRDAWDTAIRTGEDLTIPTARYATTIAGTEHNGFFANELRLAPLEMNARESAAFMAEQEQLAAEQKTTDLQPERSAVRNAVLEQLVQGGKYEASTAGALADLVTAGIGTMAENAGFNPIDVYRAYGLKVQRPELQPGITAAAAPIVQEPPAVEKVAQSEKLAGVMPGLEFVPVGGEAEANAARAPEPPAGPNADEPVNVMENIGAAALRYVSEDPDILKRAEQMRAQAFAKGRVVDKNAQGTETVANATEPTAGAAAGQEPGGPGGELAPAGPGGSAEGGRNGPRAERGRLPTIESYRANEGVFQRAAVEADAVRLTPEVRREVERIADELSNFPFTEHTWVWLDKENGLHGNAAGGHADIIPGGAGAPVYDDVLDFSPFNKGKGGAEIAKKVGGKREKVYEAARKVLETNRIHNNIAEGVVRVAERRNADDYSEISRPIIPPSWGEEASPQLVEDLSDAIETALGDTSFDPSEFGQSLFDLMNEGLEQPKTDVLDTGEQQARLPGDVGAVREQNIVTPELAEVPFSLTGEEQVKKKGKQETLFQSVYHGSPHVFEEFSLQAIGSGEGAQAYGWGLYFASKRAVADEYRRKLSQRKGLRFDDVTFTVAGTADALPWEAFRDRVADATYEHGGSREAGYSWAGSIAYSMTTHGKTLEQAMASYSPDASFFLAMKDDPGTAPAYREKKLRDLAAFVAAIDELKPEVSRERPGRTYTVDIPEDDDYLDWDKPASAQSPKVQAALEALGVKWDKFRTYTPAQFLHWFESKVADRLWNEDIGIRESLYEGYNIAKSGNAEALAAWQVKHQGLFKQGNVDPTGESIYQQIVQEKRYDPADPDRQGNPQRFASEALAGQGLAGIRYLDGFSRSSGEGSSNYVVFDDKLARIVEYDQPANDLILHHNLTAENLLHAERMGGLAIPSMAITRKGEALTGFGEITLVADAAMADPQGYARTQVYGADIYSPRYPTIHYSIPAAGEKKLSALFKANPEGGQAYIDLDSLQKEGARYLQGSGAVVAAFLKSREIAVPPAVVKPAETDRHGVTRAAYTDSFESRYRLENIVREQGLEGELQKFAEQTFESLGPVDKIFKGFTNQGNRSYQAHTLENVVKILKKEMRGGETAGNIYGMGQLRAKFTPRFKSLAGIRAAKGRLVTPAQFKAVKEELEREFFGIANQLEPSYQHEVGFQFSDTVLAVLEDAPRKGLTRALTTYGFEDVSADVQTQIGEFLTKLKTLPTEYFEAKVTREVGLEEFAGAVVPEDTSQEVIDVLARHGITSVAKYARNNEQARQEAVSQLADALGARALFQGDEQRRGSIQIGADRKMVINLFADADLSTFLHETGHFFLEVFGDLAERVGTVDPTTLKPEQRAMLADYGALLQQLGVENRSEIGRDQHEQFATMFEAYLFEGKAPTLELRSVFARFRAWLIGIYRELKNLRAPLTNEVREVLDRMLAGDQAIAEAKAASRVEPMFLDAATAGMTESQFALYTDTVARASRTARETLERKLLGEVQRERSAAWAAKREELRTVVEDQVGQQPVYIAIAAMQRGTNPDGTPLIEGFETPPLKLSRKIIVDRFGVDRLKSLPKPYIYSAEGGLDPDVVAQRFGFNSGDELLTAVAGVPGFRQAVEAETDRRMVLEHGSMLLDGTLHDEANAALSNEDRDLVIRAELRALGQLRRTAAPFVAAAQQEGRAQTSELARERAYERRWLEAEAKLRIAIAEGHKQVEIDALTAEVQNLRQKARGGAATIRAGIPPANTLKAAADARIAGMTVRAINPQVFWSASRKAAQQALERAARQDFEGAIVNKQQELLNVALYRRAMEARDDIDTRVRAAQQLGKAKTLATLGDTYADQVAGILDRFGLADVPDAILKRRPSLARFVAGLEGEGIPVDLPDEVLEEHHRREWKDLSYEELIGVTDALAHLAHLARTKNRLLKQQRQQELDALASTLASSLEEHAAASRRQGARDRRPSEERKRMVDDWFAGHRKLASLLREMDGFEDGGAMWDAIMRPLNAAGDQEAQLNAETTEKFHSLVENAFPGKEKRTLYTRLFVPSVNKSLSRMERIMVALNWGNEGNRDRIRRAEGWSDEQVKGILDSLSATDLAFAQGVFDLLESFRPAIGEKQKRITGLEPTWVEPSTITAANGTIRGGYFPLRYDDRLSAGAIKHLDLEAANLAKQAAYAHATTKRGHTKERLSNVKMKVRLDFGVMFEHVDQVIHDLTHHEALIDVGRILGHRAVQSAILAHHGDIVYKQIRGSIRDIAFGDVPAVSGFERALNHVRAGATIAGLGWNLTTAFLQPLGLSNSWVRIGPKYLTRGLYRWLRHPLSMNETIGWITEKSAFMRARGRTQQREINEIRNRVNTSTGSFGGWMDEILETVTRDTITRQGIGDSYFWMIQTMQRVADVPTWLGAYEKAMDGGETEDRAVALADQAVLDSQGGGQIKDLAQVQRGGPMMRLWTNFYSFFNVLYNQAAESKRRTNYKDPLEIGKLASDYLMLFVVPAVLGYTLREAIRPGTGKDDEGIGWRLLGEVASYIAGTMLGLREIAGVLQGAYGYEGPAGARFFAALSRLGQQVRQGEPDKALAKAAIEVGGTVLHLPAGQINRTLDGITALEEGKTENPIAVVAGAPRH